MKRSTTARRQTSTQVEDYWYSPLLGFARFYLRLPRLLRVVVAALIAVAATLAVSPLVDNVYLQYFFSPETRVVPSLVSTGIGLLTYMIGWRLTLQYDDEQPILAGVVIYLLTGVVLVGLNLVMLTIGVSIGAGS